jgi:hypothetical protein
MSEAHLQRLALWKPVMDSQADAELFFEILKLLPAACKHIGLTSSKYIAGERFCNERRRSMEFMKNLAS